MPPRGVKKGTKRARQYEHIKKSEKEAGRSEDRAEEIAARAVNKEKRGREQLYNDAKKLGIEGRSSMSKAPARGGRRRKLRSGRGFAQVSGIPGLSQYHLPRAKPPKAIKPIRATIKPAQKLQTNIRTIPTMTTIPPREIPTTPSSPAC